MEFRHRMPITKLKRQKRRETERLRIAGNEEKNRQRSKGGAGINELGVVQGQNGEQGDTIDAEQVRRLRDTTGND